MQYDEHKIKTKEDAITELIDMLRRSDTSAADIALIQGMLLENKENNHNDKMLRRAFDRILKYDPKPDLKTYRTLNEIRERLGMESVRVPRKPLYKTLGFRVAAALIPAMLVIGGAFLWIDGGKDVPPVYVTVSATPGTLNEITLPDGSTVRLQENTLLEYAENFTETRAVKLDGEAFFRVTKDSEHPFTVETKMLTVRVLGTEFNLRARPDSSRTIVSLASGSVEVRNEKQSTVLAPLEQLTYDNTTGESEVTVFDPTLIDRWRSGKQELHGVPLNDALQIIADFYGRKLIVERAPESTVDVSMTLREDKKPEDILDMILFISDAFTYEVTEQTILIR